MGSSDHILALVAEHLKRFVEDRSQLGEDRATTNAMSFVVFNLRQVGYSRPHRSHF